MKRQFITLILALALTIGAQAQQDDGMDAMMAAMIAAKVHQDSIDTSSLVAVYDYECPDAGRGRQGGDGQNEGMPTGGAALHAQFSLSEVPQGKGMGRGETEGQVPVSG